MLRDLHIWLQSLTTEDDKTAGGLRLRKLMGVALQKKDHATAIALGGMAARYGLHAEGLYNLMASALVADGRLFSARAALQTELSRYPACQRSPDLLRDLNHALQGLALSEEPQHAALCAENLQYANRHLGQRCFILGNAPSLKNHDLTLLQGEVVFSVSNGYLHPDYAVYKPQYHAVPRIPYAEIEMAQEQAARWIADMDTHVGDAVLALSLEETSLVREENVAAQRPVLPVNFALPWDRMGLNAFDLCGPVSITQSVPIMVLFLTLYMGFKEIYILGVDHNELRTKNYTYFYEKSMNTGLGGGVDDKGNITESNLTMIKCFHRLFTQYEEIKNTAARRGVAIYNANPESFLDTFPFVRYEELF